MGGTLNMEQMKKYEPTFELGDTKHKLELYRSQVQKLEVVTKEVWQKMKEEEEEELQPAAKKDSAL